MYTLWQRSSVAQVTRIDVNYSTRSNVYCLGYVRSRIGGYWCKLQCWNEYTVTGKTYNDKTNLVYESSELITFNGRNKLNLLFSRLEINRFFIRSVKCLCREIVAFSIQITLALPCKQCTYEFFICLYSILICCLYENVFLLFICRQRHKEKNRSDFNFSEFHSVLLL